MLNSLFPDIPWSRIKCVGFDLDGTLYDEFEFIRQVYAAIIRKEEKYFPDATPPYTFMLERWLEKGSTYPHIFEEVFDRHAVSRGTAREAFVGRALTRYRNDAPNLTLPERNRFLLETFSDHFDLFLISDGPSVLQRNKFKSLGLGEVFPESRVHFTGDHGKSHYKPLPAAYYHLAEKEKWPYQPEEILYFGDRDVDEAFCNNLGIRFQKVYNMVQR